MKILAVDIGTTNLKCELFDGNQSVKQEQFRIETHFGEHGKVFQYPERIIVQIKRAIRKMTQAGLEIEGIVFSTAMHTITPVLDTQLDQEMLTWQDKQSSDFIKHFKGTEEAALFYQKSGTPIHEMSPFAKIAAFKQKPWFKEVKRWVGIKELIMHSFTGRYLVDYSVASATGLLNLKKLTWDAEILSFLEINAMQLGDLVDTDYSTKILPELADELFVSREVKVYVGASDGCLASYASYVVNGTQSSLTLGTSGAVRKITKKIELDDQGKTFCYYLNKEHWVVGGATNNGGQVLDWADQVFYGKEKLYQSLTELFNESPIGSHDLLFLPYLFGERAPLWKATATSTFVGLTGRHHRFDMVRSMIEGVVFNLKVISDQVELDVRDLSVNGGFFKHEELSTLVADIFGKNCLLSDYAEPTFGAVCLVEKSAYPLFTDQKRIFFNDSNHVAYQTYYEKFKKTLKYEL